MTRFRIVLGAAGLLVGTMLPSPAAAQDAARGSGDSPWRWSALVGTSLASSPLVYVNDGSQASINLTSATALSLEVDRALTAGLTVFAGGSIWAPQLTNSGLLEVAPYPARPVYQATSFLMSVGLSWSPERVLLLGKPVLRAGVGYKTRKLDVPLSEWSAELAGDLGAGWRVSISDRSELLALYRFIPSQFNPATLPINLGGTDKQASNEHFIQLGIRWAP